MRAFKHFALAAAIVATPASSQQTPQPGQQQLSPEQQRQLLQSTMGMMVPFMGQITDMIIEASLVAAARPSTAERIATFKKNLYEALLKNGFEPAQALSIVVATAAPTAAPPQR